MYKHTHTKGIETKAKAELNKAYSNTKFTIEWEENERIIEGAHVTFLYAAIYILTQSARAPEQKRHVED